MRLLSRRDNRISFGRGSEKEAAENRLGNRAMDFRPKREELESIFLK